VFSAVLTSARVTGWRVWKPALGNRNSQVTRTNGAVSAGMPIGDSSTTMAANTMALNTAATSAYTADLQVSTKNKPPRAMAHSTGLKPYSPW
jgi:hypothetical protein